MYTITKGLKDQTIMLFYDSMFFMCFLT